MLKKYNTVVRASVFICDLAILFICWVATYYLRYKTPLMSLLPPVEVHNIYSHLTMFLLVYPVYFVVFQWLGLYRPMRMSSASEQWIAVSRASVISILVFSALLHFIFNAHYSRLTLLLFLLINIGLLVLFKVALIRVLRSFRKKGYNLKHVLIVGTGTLATGVALKLVQHLEFGYSVVGFLAKDSEDIGKQIMHEARVIGAYDDLAVLAKNPGLDQVVFCLDYREERLIRPLLNSVDNEAVDLKVILDLGDVFTLGNKIEEIDGLAMLSLRESPLFGWSSLAKRTLDVTGSLLGLVILSPLMGLIAFAIRLTSQGPIFYLQERVGMDGVKFTIYKFRSMVDNAEHGTGAVFARKNDPRTTVVGSFLRRFCLDELPQLVNVLKGDLSLVGPRPERPEFVAEFHKSIPRYMLRHKIRMGMTGWAQVNGLRGDSCINTRINYDLYYIEHWSFRFDLRILFQTFYAVLKGENLNGDHGHKTEGHTVGRQAH